MEIIVIGLLVIFVPLIMVVVGMSLINKSAESIAQTRKESKDLKMEVFANKFFKKNGVNAPWELYISEFEKQYGRKPQFSEIKVPRVRGDEVGQLMQICKSQGIY